MAEFTLTPIYQDKGGYRPPARYTQDEIPAEQAPAMQAVVAALVERVRRCAARASATSSDQS